MDAHCSYAKYYISTYALMSGCPFLSSLVPVKSSSTYVCNQTWAALLYKVIIIIIIIIAYSKLIFEYDQMRVTSKIPKKYKQKQ